MKERLLKLYQNGLEGRSPSISEKGVLNAVTKGWITTDDAIEIIGEVNALEVVRIAKLNEMSKTCNSIIVAGIDVKTSNGVEHFTLSAENQSTIDGLFKVVELGGTEYPYHADNGSCTIYTTMEIANIYIAKQSLITTQLTYHNGLKKYIKTLDNVETIKQVVYGMDLPEPYNSDMLLKLSVAKTQMEAIIARLGG